MSRRRPFKNVDAGDFLAFLEGYLTRPLDLDGVRRTYLNGVHLDPSHRRELRRYRNGQVASVRPSTAHRIADHFNLTQEYTEWQARN